MDKLLFNPIKTYKYSLDENELLESANTLNKLYKDPTYSDLRDDAFVILVKTLIKKNLISFFHGDFYKKSCEDTISALVSLETKISNRGNMENTLKNICEIKTVLQNIFAVFSDFEELEIRGDQLFEKDSGQALKEIDDLISLIEQKKEKLSFLLGEKLIRDEIVFIDPYETCLKKIDDSIAHFTSLKEKVLFERNDQIIKDYLVELRTVYNISYEFYPDIDNERNRFSNILFIHSPLIEDVRLAILAHADERKMAISYLDVNKLKKAEDKEILDFFSSVRERKINLYVEGLSNYSYKNFATICKEMYLCGKEGIFIYIHDGNGSSSLYNSFVDNIRELDGSFLDVSETFLNVPNYKKLIEILANYKLLNDINDDNAIYVKNNMPFLGYSGLNQIIATFLADGDWKNKGRSVSFHNFGDRLKNFIEELPSPSMFIDSGWESEFKAKLIDNDKSDFDYDRLRDCNKKNIEKIIKANISFYEKAGCLVRYILLHGDDTSVWNRLTSDEQFERITESVYSLFSLFEIDYLPKVEHVSLRKFKAAGMCVNGGRIIQFDTGKTDFESIFDTICHECFHAFQHKTLCSPFFKWYKQDLGITVSRIEEWRLNNNSYFDNVNNFDMYRVQIFESDAFSFAAECVRTCGDVWGTIDFE